MKKEFEALTWLKNNENRSPFAANFFGDKKSILNFVIALYEAGTENVEIGNTYDEDWRIKSEGGPYADELIITFPKNKDKKLNIVGLIMKNRPDEYFDVDEKSNIVNWSKVKTISLWWD
jgi:hypothetical protein